MDLNLARGGAPSGTSQGLWTPLRSHQLPQKLFLYLLGPAYRMPWAPPQCKKESPFQKPSQSGSRVGFLVWELNCVKLGRSAWWKSTIPLWMPLPLELQGGLWPRDSSRSRQKVPWSTCSDLWDPRITYFPSDFFKRQLKKNRAIMTWI